MPEIEDAVEDYFGEDYEVVSTEERLMVPIEGYEDYNFKGFIDAVIKTSDGKYHIMDWKSCSWGWNAQRRREVPITPAPTASFIQIKAQLGGNFPGRQEQLM